MNTLPTWMGDKKQVAADRIVSIEDYLPEVTPVNKTITFESGKVMHVVGQWFNKEQPKVDGYVVIDEKDKRKCYYMEESQFRKQFMKVGE